MLENTEQKNSEYGHFYHKHYDRLFNAYAKFSEKLVLTLTKRRRACTFQGIKKVSCSEILGIY